MTGWRRLWILLVFLGWTCSSLPVVAAETGGCCCEQVLSVQQQAPCQCGETGEHSHCQISADHELPAALERTTPAPGRDELAAGPALVWTLVSKREAPTPAFTRGTPAGWTLPGSPPLPDTLLSLPPPCPTQA